MSKIYEFTVHDAANNEVPLSLYKGKVLLIVNTATHCGFTPQYEGLEALYKKYHDLGLELLDFPCNQFGHQAKEPVDEIHSICVGRFGTSFPTLEKIEVNGKNEHPLYTYLKGEASGKLGNNIKWNFTKFLIDREGNVIKRFSPTVTPAQIDEHIAALI
jgi:glutathione peroxidase